MIELINSQVDVRLFIIGGKSIKEMLFGETYCMNHNHEYLLHKSKSEFTKKREIWIILSEIAVSYFNYILFS